MKQIKQIKQIKKKAITIISLLVVLFCAVPVLAQSEQEGIFRGEQKLKTGDTIYFEDVLTYKKGVEAGSSTETVSEELIAGTLPQGLLQAEAAADGSAAAITVSAAVPGEAQAGITSGLLSIPCRIDPAAVSEETVTIDGITLYVRNRESSSRAPGNGELPAYTMGLYATAADVYNNSPLQNGAVIGLNDDFYIGIHKAAFTDVAADTPYTIQLPDKIGTPTASGSTPLTLEGTAISFGTLAWVQGTRALTVTFSNFQTIINGVEIELEDLVDIAMAFECNLDSAIQPDDNQGKVIINLPGDKTLEITVPELKPQPPKLEKTAGALQADGTVLWTVTYTHPAGGYEGAWPEQLVDTIPDKLQYIGGSEKVYKNGSTTPEATTNIVYSNGKLTYDITAAALSGGDKVAITYKTELTQTAWSELWANKTTEYRYENKVEGTDASGAAITPALSAKATLIIPKNWAGREVLSKGASVTGSGDSRTITWTVKVKAMGKPYQTLTVTDTMGKGLILQDGSGATSDTILVKDQNGNTPSFTSEIIGSPGAPTVMTLKLIENASPNPAAEEYTITYDTKIDPVYFNNPGSLTDADISNNVALSYSWPAGTEPSAPAMPPSISKTPGEIQVNNALIKKEAASAYDYTKNALTWNITINPNEVNVTEAVFTDNLSGATHVFVPAGTDAAAAEALRQEIETKIKTAMTAAGLSDSLLLNVDIEGNVLTVKLGNIGMTKFTFPVTTYVTDPGDWAGNESHTYHNTVTMLQSGTKIGGNEITTDNSASANKQITNNVLKKASGNYIPAEKKIEWTLTVNEHAVNLGDVTITDVLPEILSCTAEDVSAAVLNGASFSGNNTFSFDSSDNTITVQLDQVTAKKVIQFKTSVDVDAALFKTQENIAISNQAGMVSEANASEVKSNQVNITLGNKAISKEAGQAVDGQVLPYTIKLNPFGMNLLEGQPAGTKLTISDKLPDGLYLDMESIKIHEATAGNVAPAQGGKYNVSLTQGAEVTNPKIEYQASENAFSLEIPDASKSYIIKYNAYIVRAGVELKNNVKLMGSVLQGGDNHSSASSSFTLHAFGSAGFSLPREQFISLRIKKVDKNGAKLNGAEFALYADNEGENLLAKGTTDAATGICTLAIPRAAAAGIDTMYWKEITAPAGYGLNDEWHEVDVTNLPTTDLTMVNYSSAEASSGKIRVYKQDENGDPLSGAVFALYKEKACINLAAAEKTTNNQGVIIFDGLIPDRLYWLKEVKAPAGYVPFELISVRTLGDGTEADLTIANKRANVTLAITKVDGENNELKIANTEFSLFEDLECTSRVGEVKKTNQQGIASFENLMPNTTYYVKETKAAADYIENTQVYPVVTAENNATIAMEMINFKKMWNQKASIEVMKTDETGNVKLEQAVFELYADDQLTLLGEKTTDANGICTFDQLKEGTYYLKETKAPEGYKLDDSLIEVAVALNTKNPVTVKNKLLDAKEENPGDKPADPESTDTNQTNTADDNAVKTIAQTVAQTNSTIPKTGVEDQIIWYALGLAASLLAAGGLIWLLIRRKKLTK